MINERQNEKERESEQISSQDGLLKMHFLLKYSQTNINMYENVV